MNPTHGEKQGAEIRGEEGGGRVREMISSFDFLRTSPDLLRYEPANSGFSLSQIGFGFCSS